MLVLSVTTVNVSKESGSVTMILIVTMGRMNMLSVQVSYSSDNITLGQETRIGSGRR